MPTNKWPRRPKPRHLLGANTNQQLSHLCGGILRQTGTRPPMKKSKQNLHNLPHRSSTWSKEEKLYSQETLTLSWKSTTGRLHNTKAETEQSWKNSSKTLASTQSHWNHKMATGPEKIDTTLQRNQLSTMSSPPQTKNLVIDEDGLLRMKGKNESDHNTITLQVKEQIQKDHTKRWIWRTNNEEAWHDFNKEMETTSVEKTESYDCFEKHLKALMTRHLEKITIKPEAIRKPSNPTIKRLKREKRELKKNSKKLEKTTETLQRKWPNTWKHKNSPRKKLNNTINKEYRK